MFGTYSSCLTVCIVLRANVPFLTCRCIIFSNLLSSRVVREGFFISKPQSGLGADPIGIM